MIYSSSGVRAGSQVVLRIREFYSSIQLLHRTPLLRHPMRPKIKKNRKSRLFISQFFFSLTSFACLSFHFRLSLLYSIVYSFVVTHTRRCALCRKTVFTMPCWLWAAACLFCLLAREATETMTSEEREEW